MSSFNSRVTKAEKEKATKSNTPSGKGRGKKKEDVPMIENTSTDEPVEQVESAVPADTVSEQTEELYGEEQQEQDKPKWERMIPLDRIRPNPYQPRKTFDAAKLDELGSGMKEHGWIGGGLPVRAATNEPNIYELVWGERRWRAARIAGLQAIPCVVSSYTDDDMIEKGLLENVQREDLNQLEEGQAYVNLLALKTGEGKPRYSIRRLAARIGKDKSYIEDRLQFARVPIDVQQLAIDQPDISARIIRELGELSKILKPEERAPVVEGVREGKLRIEDVREIRKDVEQQIKKEPPATTPSEQSAPVAQLVEQTTEIATFPTTTQTSVATDTPPPSSPAEEKQSEEVGEEQVPSTSQAVIPTPEPVRSAPAKPTPMTTAMTISVFEKTLKRDNEALERVFQHITETFETLTTDEQNVLRRYVQRWNASLQDLMSRIEQPEME